MKPARHMVEIPANSNIVQQIYTIYAGFETCPDAMEIIEEACGKYLDPNMPYTISTLFANTFFWTQEETECSITALSLLQQTITTVLQSIGIPAPYSVEIYKQNCFSLYLLVKERINNGTPHTTWTCV